MPWRGRFRQNCRVCDGHRDVVGQLSARGKCSRCGLGRVAVNATQLHEHSGPYFEHWRRAMVACVGGVLVDDVGETD